MKHLFFICIVLPIGLLRAGMSSGDPKEPLPDIAKLLANTEGTEVFEGLPHQLFERSAMEAEKKNKKVFSVAGQYFYEKKLPVTETDKASLDLAFYADDFIRPYGGPKLCGGFHADYLIVWLRKDAPPTQALVCFGCGEIEFVFENSTFPADFTSGGYKSLKNILSKYRQERPRNEPTPKVKPEPMPPPKISIEIPQSPAKP